jgi:hypothetical protein
MSVRSADPRLSSMTMFEAALFVPPIIVPSPQCRDAHHSRLGRGAKVCEQAKQGSRLPRTPSLHSPCSLTPIPATWRRAASQSQWTLPTTYIARDEIKDRNHDLMVNRYDASISLI